MKALVIVILILTVLLLIPIGIDCGYSGGEFMLRLRLGLLNIRNIPGRIKNLKFKKQKKPAAEIKAGPEKVQKAKEPLNKDKLFRLAKLGLKTLGRLRRKLHVDYLRIRYTFATDDPFNTAIGFGRSSAALGAIMPLFDNAFNITERDIGTSFNFLSDEPVFDCWITFSIQVWEVFYIAAAFGIDYLKIRNKQKRDDSTRKE
ncbi:MAG: hypothetical protein QMB62_11120 [Oscillospiraceae bacterium]